MLRNSFDYTTLSTYMTCQRKYMFRMVEDIVPKTPSTAPEFGRCIHLALDEWYRSKDIDRTVNTFKASFVENPEDDKRTHKMGEWILRNYDDKYRDQPFRVLSSELEFNIPLNAGNFLTGRIDKIVEWDGSVWVLDHKTTSQLGPNYMKMHTPNLQFDGYVWAAKKLGHKTCCGVIVDAILVAKGLLETARRSSLTPLLRDMAYRSSNQLTRYEDTLYNIIHNIQVSEVNKLYVPNYDACTYYGECPYRRICKEDSDMWSVIMREDFNVDKWNPIQGEVA